MAVSTKTVSFGDVVLGDGVTEMLELTNTSGDVSVEIQGVTLDPPAMSTDYSTDFDSATGITLGPKETAEIAVRFEPSAENDRDATVLVTHDASYPEGPYEVELEGRGVGRLELSPAELSFRTVVVGSSDELEVTLSNRSGEESVTIQDVTSSDTEFTTDFDASNPVTLGTDDEPHVLTVTFTPDSAADDKTATLTFDVDDESGTDVTVDVTGRGVDAETDGALEADGSAPGEVDFSDVELEASETLTVRVYNTDDDTDEDVASVEMELTTAEEGEFELTEEPSSFTIGAMEHRDFVVRFTPAAAGAREAELVLKDDSDADIASFTVTGSGVEPGDVQTGPASVSVEAGELDFGLVPVGSRARRSVVLVHGGDADTDAVTVEEVTSGNADVFGVLHDFDADADGPIALAPGESARIGVVYEPPDESEHTATLTVTLTGAAENSHTVELSGAGDGTALTAAAVGPGVWGNNVALHVEDASLANPENDLFKLVVRYWSRDADADTARAHGGDTERDEVPTPTVEEVYDNLSPTETSADYYVNRVNGASNLVELERAAGSDARPSNTAGHAVWLWDDGREDEDVTVGHFEGDEQLPPGTRTGLAGLAEKDQISIVCVPDENHYESEGALTDAVRIHCETLKDRIAVLQTEEDPGKIDTIRPPVDSTYAAYYYPWLTVLDPLTNARKNVPPCGHIAGVYARTDTERGVHKAPANAVVRGVIEPRVPIAKAEQDILNPLGVNCIRTFAGRGTRVWGARTTSSNPLWKYVNVRRLFLYIEESIDEGTQWSVFEPNDEPLWARIRQSVTNFLTTTWRDGALQGATPDQAFFVTCDRTTMTQDDIDNGRLIVEIGVAPVKPAEFVIFRISQWTGGVEESA
uniref:choice-of-anchor D domain-containing protein n=1 Tax=Halogeometricum limi TaxID=555875 RepID=UPI00373FCB69